MRIIIFILALGLVAVFWTRSWAEEQAFTFTPDDVARVHDAYTRAMMEGDMRKVYDLSTAEVQAQMKASFGGEIPEGKRAGRVKNFYGPGAKIYIRDGKAAALEEVVYKAEGQADKKYYYGMMYVPEGNALKFRFMAQSEIPFHISSFLPPEEGAFGRAGQPWEKIATVPLFDFGDMKIKAVHDLHYLYLLFTVKDPIPPPGMALEEKNEYGFPKMPRGIPTFPILNMVAKNKAYTVNVSDVASARFEAGKSRHFLNYSMVVADGTGDYLLNTHAENADTRYIAISRNVMQVRVPLDILPQDFTTLSLVNGGDSFPVEVYLD